MTQTAEQRAAARAASVVPSGILEHEIASEARGDRSAFDREGYVVARGAFAPEVLRELRAPLFQALIRDGSVEPDPENRDRLIWTGDEARFDRHDYERWIVPGVEDLLLKSGVAATTMKSIWARRGAFWEYIQLFVAPPGHPPSPHRDAIPLSATTESSGQVRLWFPLTQLDQEDGALALAVGTHRIPDQPADAPPLPHLLHPGLRFHTGNLPPAEELAPLWRSTSFEVGDALVFRSDVVHTTAVNAGRHLRLAIVLTVQDADVPVGCAAGMSFDSARPLTDVEWVTLAILAAQPTSPWRARCAFYPRGVVGRTWMEQPGERIERACAVLEARKLIEPHATHSDHFFWQQRFYHATGRGRSEVMAWLTAPRASDARLLALKMLLCEWLGLDPGGTLNVERGTSNGEWADRIEA